MPDYRPLNDPSRNPGIIPPRQPQVPTKPLAFTEAVPAQPWYTSKTTWMGILTMVISLLPFIGNVIPTDERDAFASAMATVAPVIGSIVGALVIYFRRTADAPIKNGPADPVVKASD